jgi:hypothetical protein
VSVQLQSKKNFLILILLSLFLLAFRGVVQGETPVWQNIETKYTIIHYQSLEGLRKFDDRVNYGEEEWGLQRLFFTQNSHEIIDRIKKKVDVLFERVQQILDMRKKMKKVTINVYRDKEQLHDAYFEQYKTSCRIRAWYEYKYNTVYVNVDDLHEGMLAHELAHAIIDHYLLVRPPTASAEILTRYVDKHLKK